MPSRINSFEEVGVPEGYENKHPVLGYKFFIKDRKTKKQRLIRDVMFNFSDDQKIVVEVGSRHGPWALRAATHLPDDCHIYCIDPWKSCKEWGPGEQNLWDWALNLKDWIGYKVTGLKGVSEDFIEDFDDMSIDLCFIDGDHAPKSVLNDCRLWWPKIAPGGALVGHDISTKNYHEPVKKGVDAAFGTYSIEECFRVDADSNRARSAHRCWVVRKPVGAVNSSEIMIGKDSKTRYFYSKTRDGGPSHFKMRW